MRDRSMLYQGQRNLLWNANQIPNSIVVPLRLFIYSNHCRKPANNSPLQYPKYTNIYLQVMITRHNIRLHEVLWWQGWVGGCGVCQAGGRPSQAGPAWPGRIMLGRGRQDIQVMMRIRILLIFYPCHDLQGHPRNTQLLLQQGVQTSLPQDCTTRIGSRYIDICCMLYLL